MSPPRRVLRGAAREIAAAVQACRAAADRGDAVRARELESKLYLRTLRHIANGSRRGRRLAIMALAVAIAVNERFGPANARSCIHAQVKHFGNFGDEFKWCVYCGAVRAMDVRAEGSPLWELPGARR